MNKSIIHRILALLYLGVMAVCIVFAIKAGASIFYYKKAIDNQSLKPDLGFAQRYYLEINPHLFRTQDMLLFEDGHQMGHDTGSAVINSGNGTYSVSDPTTHGVYIYLSALDNSNPSTNGRKYSIYLPYSFISRPLGFIYILVLSPILIGFVFFAFGSTDRRKIVFQSPTGILRILDDYFESINQLLSQDTEPRGQLIKNAAQFWKRLFTITVIAAFIYIFLEWLFFVTKSSFMDVMSLAGKINIFLISGLFFSLTCMLVLAGYIVVELILIGIRRSRIARYIGAAIPTVILSALALLIIDNFTYTVFKYGISTSTGALRGAYRLLLVFLMIIIYLQILNVLGLKSTAVSKERPTNRLFYFTLGLLLISTIMALTNLDIAKLISGKNTAAAQVATSHPNIILLGSDGLSADHMSVYGYERNTTPRLEELAKSSLFVMNAFSNSGNTTGSLSSLFTSKLPTTTRVADGGDILTGKNAFEHLPGILKSEGYKEIQYGFPGFVDAYNLNMQNSFDIVNGRSQRDGSLASIVRKLGYDYPAYFLDSLSWRISERILHIFFIRDMENPYLLVTKPADNLSDQQKIDQMLSDIDKSQDPLFVHVHLMGTHGPKFLPSEQVFSKGEQQDQPWMVDFYDDKVLLFDQYVGQVIDHLKANGEFNNTILVIYTDHDWQWLRMLRIPLIIHFPGDQYAGKITSDVQNMDIAPTILNYLGLPKPEWMMGDSILNSDGISRRLILGVSKVIPFVANSDRTEFYNSSLMDPPFYEFGGMFALDCQKWFNLNLKTLQFSSGDIQNYPTPCNPDSLYTNDEVIQVITNQLTMDGFDTSSLSKITVNKP